MGIFECYAAEKQAMVEVKSEAADDFQAALQAYLDGDMDLAARGFGVLAGQGDLVAQYLLMKALYYRAEGLPADWTGVEVMEEK